MDDSIANDNLAADDSMDLMIDDGACIQHDSSSNNLKSAGLSDSGIDQDKNSITHLKVRKMSLMIILMRMKRMILKIMRMSPILKMTKGMMNF